MDNNLLTINELISQSYGTALEKGWWDKGDRPLMECLMLIVSEISEAGEEYRVHGLDPEFFEYEKEGKPEGIAVELADVLIRIADLCGRYNIDLESALLTKLEFNKTRKYRHGGKIC